MVELIERLAIDLPAIAPELVAHPKTSMYRIYRDTRFSPNKAPFKTHVAAIFRTAICRSTKARASMCMSRRTRCSSGAGLYRPQPRELHRLREHIAANSRRLLSLTGAPTFRRSFGELSGERLQRVPRGFPPEHEAADLLRLKQFLAGCERRPSFATGPRFYHSLLRLFGTLAPVVQFLNEPLAAGELRLEDTLPAGPPPR